MTFGEIKNFVGEEVKKFNETIIKYDTVLINLSQNIKKDIWNVSTELAKAGHDAHRYSFKYLWFELYMISFIEFDFYKSLHKSRSKFQNLF